jgi:hypothetical protein
MISVLIAEFSTERFAAAVTIQIRNLEVPVSNILNYVNRVLLSSSR